MGAARRRSRRRILRLSRPLDLSGTVGHHVVGGRADPTWSLGADEFWRAQLTPVGPATIHVRLSGASVLSEAWGPGAEHALDLLPSLLGEDDDRMGFEPGLDPLVHRMDRTHAGLRVGASGTVTTTAIATVLAQRVTAGESIRAWRGLVRRWGERSPGPGATVGLFCPPVPRELASLSYSSFHPLGVGRGRAETIRLLARHSARLDSWSALPRADAWREATRVLTLLRGVGPWTESIVRGTALGDPDAVVVGDLHIPHQVCHALEGSDRGSDDRMLELLAPFAGHRGRAQRLVLRAPGRPPRRAPRYAPLPIARM